MMATTTTLPTDQMTTTGQLTTTPPATTTLMTSSLPPAPSFNSNGPSLPSNDTNLTIVQPTKYGQTSSTNHPSSNSCTTASSYSAYAATLKQVPPTDVYPPSYHSSYGNANYLTNNGGSEQPSSSGVGSMTAYLDERQLGCGPNMNLTSTTSPQTQTQSYLNNLGGGSTFITSSSYISNGMLSPYSTHIYGPPGTTSFPSPIINSNQFGTSSPYYSTTTQMNIGGNLNMNGSSYLNTPNTVPLQTPLSRVDTANSNNTALKTDLVDPASIKMENSPATKGSSSRKRKSSSHKPNRPEDAKALRIRKHNEAEVRRRLRLKGLLQELSEVTDCGKSHKSAILRATIDRMRLLKTKLASFGIDVPALMKEADRKAAVVDDDDDDDQVEEPPTQRTTRGLAKQQAEAALKAATQPQAVMSTGGVDASVKFEPIDLTYPGVMNRNTSHSSAHSECDHSSSSSSRRGSSPSVTIVNGHIQKKHKSESGLARPSQSTGFDGVILPNSILSPSSIAGVNHHHLFHSANVPMDIIDYAGNILDCNEAFARFTGYPRGVLVNPGTTFLGLTHPDSLSASYKLMSGLISGKRSVTRARKKYVTNGGIIKNSIVTCWLVSPDSSSSLSGRSLYDPTAAPHSTGTPLIQAMIEEIPFDTELDESYFDIPYHPMASLINSVMTTSQQLNNQQQQLQQLQQQTSAAFANSPPLSNLSSNGWTSSSMISTELASTTNSSMKSKEEILMNSVTLMDDTVTQHLNITNDAVMSAVTAATAAALDKQLSYGSMNVHTHDHGHSVTQAAPQVLSA